MLGELNIVRYLEKIKRLSKVKPPFVYNSMILYGNNKGYSDTFWSTLHSSFAPKQFQNILEHAEH